MVDRAFFVTFIDPPAMTETVIAAIAEIHGEHLAFLDSRGKLAALFMLELVKSWNVLPLSRAPQQISPLR
jgi:hypothetical protein